MTAHTKKNSSGSASCYSSAPVRTTSGTYCDGINRLRYSARACRLEYDYCFKDTRKTHMCNTRGTRGNRYVRY